MEQYSEVCRPMFGEIHQKLDSIEIRTVSIEKKVYNGFEEKITNTNTTVDKLERKIDSLQSRLNALIITASGGAIGIIVTLWLTLGG